MANRWLYCILCSVLCIIGFQHCYAQEECKVKVTYQYPMDEHETMAQAKYNALSRAKIKAIADKFGTIIAKQDMSVMDEINGKTTDAYYSLSIDEVRGEWVKTIGEPKYDFQVIGGDQFWIVTVEGIIRKIEESGLDFTVACLRNGYEMKFASQEFKEGDDVYTYFKAPASGYLALFLLEELTQIVYCTLPYKAMDIGTYPVKHDKPYIFFSPQKNADKNIVADEDVDEYNVSLDYPVEIYTLYAIYSTHNFTKPLMEDGKLVFGGVEYDVPRHIDVKKFNSWLSACRAKDKDMAVKKIRLTYRK